MMKQRKFWVSIMLLLTLAMTAGCNHDLQSRPSDQSTDLQAKEKLSDPPLDKTEWVPVKIYFAMKSEQMLAPEIHQLKKDETLLKKALELLAAGPKNPDLFPVVSPNVKILGVIVQDRIAMADFSRELVEKAYGGSYEEILTVAAIANTLTEFSGVDAVQILVEGKKITTLAGHIDVSEPLSRAPEIIIKQAQ